MEEKEKWYHPKVKTGWHKYNKPTTRRNKVLRAHKGDELAAARSMQALANVTQDRETARIANDDAQYFFLRHEAETARSQPRVSRAPMRITPKTPRIR